MKSCPNCHSKKMMLSKIDHKTNYKNKNISIKGINVYKCQNCTELFLKTGEDLISYLEKIKLAIVA